MASKLKTIILTTNLQTVFETVRTVRTWQERVAAIADTVFINNASSEVVIAALNDLNLSNQVTEIELGELIKVFPLLDAQDLIHRLHWVCMDVKRTESALSRLNELLKAVAEPWAVAVVAEIEALLA